MVDLETRDIVLEVNGENNLPKDSLIFEVGSSKVAVGEMRSRGVRESP